MKMSSTTGYSPIEDYSIIGDMHTCALVSKSGSLDFMCWPVFDSPSVFCRLLDKNKGGHFSINPHEDGRTAISKQNYQPYTNMLETRWIHEDGVVNVIDYFPVSGRKPPTGSTNLLSGWCNCVGGRQNEYVLNSQHSGVIRKVNCVRGTMDMAVELFPAFNYARDEHKIIGRPVNDTGNTGTQTLTFESPTERILLDIHVDTKDENTRGFPEMRLELQDRPGINGKGLVGKIRVSVDQSVTFIVRSNQTTISTNDLSQYIDRLESETYDYWTAWTRKCTFRGHYREQVERSLLVLKLLTYRPTGSIVAAPTFSLPEDIGGARNWDYRYSWIRDTAFTLYVFLKNGYNEEAEAYISFIFDRIIPSVGQCVERHGEGHFLPILLSIRGEHEIPEMELDHLEGYRGSRPVRIGNAATSHTQLDTYGELLDSIYLYNKYAGPISYDQWLGVRRIVNHIIKLRDEPDMSIWEVRGEKQNFVYSKIMIWVTIDRGIRLAEKRSNLPLPERNIWYLARDELYEEIMTKGYNMDGGYFCMSYENRDILDASVLIAPLVFFIAPDDPRFISTLNKIMQSPEEGGLTSAKMVFRYDHTKVDDGKRKLDLIVLFI